MTVVASCRSRVGLALLAALACGPVAVQAQAVPPTVDPSRVPMPAPPPEVRPTSPADVQLPERPAALPDGASDTRFVVRDLRIVGATAIDPATFDADAASVKGREVTLAELYTLAERITLRYRQQGYLLSRAYVPAQRVGDGVFEIRIVEGYIGDVTFRGDHPPVMDASLRELQARRPVRGDDLQRFLLLADDVPGYQVHAVLEPSTGDRASTRLTLVVDPLRKLRAYIGTDNRQSRYFGPWEVYAGAAVNDVTGHGDNAAVRVGGALPFSSLAFGELEYGIPIGGDGLRVEALVGANRGNPGFVLAPFEVRTRSSEVALRVVYPFVRRRQETLKGSLSLTGYDGRSTYFGEGDLPPSSRDRIRALRFGLAYDVSGQPTSRTLLKADFSHGLGGIMGADSVEPLPSRPGGRTDFDKFSFEVQRDQALGRDASAPFWIAAAFTAQTSFGQRLLLPEQFGVGGSFYGRAYDASEITGDRGIAGRIELQYRPLSSAAAGWGISGAQLYGFWDAGKVWNEDPAVYTSASLASAGIGVRAYVARQFFVDVQVDKPLTRRVATEVLDNHSGHGARAFANLVWVYER